MHYFWRYQCFGMLQGIAFWSFPSGNVQIYVILCTGSRLQFNQSISAKTMEISKRSIHKQIQRWLSDGLLKLHLFTTSCDFLLLVCDTHTKYYHCGIYQTLLMGQGRLVLENGEEFSWITHLDYLLTTPVMLCNLASYKSLPDVFSFCLLDWNALWTAAIVQAPYSILSQLISYDIFMILTGVLGTRCFLTSKNLSSLTLLILLKQASRQVRPFDTFGLWSV